MASSKPDIFSYLDYRSFLKDAIERIQAESPVMTFRNFARLAGFSSPNFLQQVIQRKRNLGSANTLATAKAFKLNRHETDFFQSLIGYDQARDLDEKNHFYQKIAKNKRYSTVKTLDKSQFEAFSHWFIPVVRELVTHKDYNGSDAWIADRISPSITATQVAHALETLERLGLIAKNAATGKWNPTEMVISTDSEVADLAFRNYHMAAIQLAHRAVKNIPSRARDIRSVTIGLPKGAYLELKSRLEAVWKDLLSFAGQYRESEIVYQVNMQVFPLTREGKQPRA